MLPGMNVRRTLLGAILVAASWAGFAASVAAAATPAPPPSVPAAPPEGHIDGVALSRPGGGFLGLRLVDGRFVIGFYDADKHPVPVDVAAAALRWPVHYQPADERAYLTPGGDGTVLTSDKVVRPPHRFRVFVSLFRTGSDEAVETYSVDFSG
jgi:hypothetical protein